MPPPAEAPCQARPIEPDPEHAHHRPPLPSATSVAITVAGIAATAALIWQVDPLRDAVPAALRGDTEQVREDMDGLGIGGPLIVLALCCIHAVVFYPTEIVDAAAGYVYGFGPALALVMFGWMLNGWICLAIGRSVGRPVLHRLLGAERFERVEGMVERGGVTLLLAVRLVPIIPFSLTSYAAGAAHVPFWRFTWTTAIGYLPLTAIAVFLGTRLEDFSPTDPLFLAGLAAILALLAAANWVIPRAGADSS